MDSLSRRDFLASMGTITAGGLAGMSLREAMAQPIEKLAENIPTRPLGKTGHQAKILGFGMMNLRKRPYSHYTTKQDAEHLIRTAIDCGINTFDIARVYAGIEELSSSVLPKYRDKLFITTKSAKSTKKDFLNDLEISLAAAKLDYFDVVMMHAVSSYRDWVRRTTGDDCPLAGAKQAQKEGKARFIGISSHGSVPAVMAAIRSGEIDVIVHPYNPIYREFERALVLAEKLKNVGILIMKPFGHSFLLPDFQHLEADRIPLELQDRNATFTVEECLKFALSAPYSMSLPITGMSTLDHLKQNVAIAATFKPLTQNERRDLDARRERYTGGVCGSCKGKPCEKACPNQVPISTMLSGLQLTNRTTELYRMRLPGQLYTALPHDYLDCDGCGNCEKVCPNKFAIRKHMETAHRTLSSD